MNRFDPLYQHFEKYMGAFLATMHDVDRKQLVFVYRDGVYRAYWSKVDQPKSTDTVEINPASALTSMREIWFFQDQQGLSAYVEYQPDYRPRVLIDNPGCPFIQFQPKDRPAVPGLH